MNIVRRCAAGSIFAIALLTPFKYAWASNEILFFRLNNSGQVEAVVSGDFVLGCSGSPLPPPTSVTISGNSIVIVSPPPTPFGIPCLFPPPPATLYQVVANLGVLTGPSYNVTWGALSAVLVPASLTAVGIPTMNAYVLALMAVLIVATGMRFTRHP
jgi:hypothetical protein